MIARLAKESMSTAVGCFLASGYFIAAGITLKLAALASWGLL